MKFIRRDYAAGISVAQDAAAIQDFMCSEIADMIVSTDTGWDYDERTPTKTSFISLTNGGGTSSRPQTPYPVLYLRNSLSGAKLAIVSVYMNISSNASASDMASKYDPVTTTIFQNKTSGDRAFHPSGIGMAFIPPGVNTEFPDSYASDTSLGTGALNFVCEYGGYAANTNASSFYQNMNGAMSRIYYYGEGTVVSYGILADDKSIFLFSGSGSGARGSLDLIYGIGKMLGTLAYDSEEQMQYYAGLKFKNMGMTQVSSNTSLKPSNGSFSFYGNGPYTDNALSYCVETFAQDGTLRDGKYCVIGEDLLALSVTNSESPDAIRWQPGIIFSQTGDPFYTGGDRFKGYLDTNLIRYAIANQGQLFNNGQFCCVATNLLLKWDPDATDTILA